MATIEEKAKAYDEAIEKLDVILNLNTVKESGTIFADDVRKILPELKESEDERIRKMLIEQMERWHECALENNVVQDIKDSADAIAWLEAQGEHANFRNKIQVGDKVTRNEDGVLVNLSQLKRVAKRDEKQGEQKPAWSEEDKVMLDKVIERLHKHSAGDKEYLDIYYWLIALKDRVQPQPKQEWKPSDEQIELLREVQQALLGKDCHNRFVNFMYELKRLREE